ncbi:MAG: response regulator [Alphaproteobacteria bacterium]|uniref:Phosphate regulon transcriptional regulatory protein PhoB n=1 Tax=Candidatus Nitrobium versatile TaxID=2884831 RepID=A0A953J217_9BACT|nr:response regulator [Candidatus Nitrobium versatile]
MKRILVIDDEADIVELVRYNLEKEGFSVESAPEGESALRKVREERYDLLVLDLMLPGIQGLELCRIIRNDPSLSRIPIVMLTAKGEEVDRIIGLEMGADDYLSKPFSPRELVARIKAVLRRMEMRKEPAEATEEGTDALRVRDIDIDRAKYTVAVGGRQIKLSATEFRLLLYLCERPNKIYSREHLLDAVWGDDVFVEPRTVDVHIRRLRTKLEEDPNNPKYIKTMRGVGYFFEV